MQGTHTGRFHDWTGGSTVTGEGQIAAGNYLSIPKNTAPAVWGNQIPSMQGFLLKFTIKNYIYIYIYIY